MVALIKPFAYFILPLFCVYLCAHVCTHAVDVNSLMFARGTRFSHVEAQERYREECQRVFDLQNK